MAQLFNLGPSSAANFGSSLGTGLGGVLDQLGQKRQMQKQQQGMLQGLSALGFNPQESAQLSQLPPQILQDIVKQKLQAPQQQAYSQALQGLLGGQQGQPQQQAGYVDSLGQQQESPPAGSPQQSIIPAGLTQQQATELAKLGLKQQALERQSSAAEQKEIRQSVVPFIKDIQGKARGAQENDMRLDRMTALIDTGKLNNPTFASAVKSLSKGIFGIGIDLSSLLSPESQQFEKLSNDFLKSIKDVFGARISNLEVENFLKTVPTLSQSNEGKLAVIENLRNMNEGIKIRRDATKQLIDKYGSKLPFDFEDQVEVLAKPRLDEIAERFKVISTQKQAPPTSGSKVKAGLGAAGGALAGSRIGGLGGVPGAVAGGALGGLAGLSGLI